MKMPGKLLPTATISLALLTLTFTTSGLYAQGSGNQTRVSAKLDAASRFLALPPAEEQRIGNEMNDEIRKKYKVSSNQRLNSYIEYVGARLARHSNESTTIKFTTLDDPETVNAFAIPGGYIYITTGMIDKLDNESELAAVLSHEIGHITEDHVHARIRNQVGTKLAVGFLGKLFDKDLSGSKLVQAGNYLLTQKFSRKHEYAADTAGARIMTAAGYNPKGMVTLQDKLYKMSQGSLNIEFIASHPSSAKRRDEIAEYIRANGLSKPGLITNTARFNVVK